MSEHAGRTTDPIVESPPDHRHHHGRGGDMSDDPMVAVLAKHQWRDPRQYGYGPSECDGCDWSGTWLDQGDHHAAHLADVLRATGYIHRDEQETSLKHNKRGDLLREVCCVCGDAFFVCTGCDVAMCECSRDGDCAATPPDHACDERCDHLGEWLGGGAR